MTEPQERTATEVVAAECERHQAYVLRSVFASQKETARPD